MRQVARRVYPAVALLILSGVAGALGAELAPDVIAQVDQSGGYDPSRAKPLVRTVRVFVDGRIEAFDEGEWSAVGRFAEGTVRRHKD